MKDGKKLTEIELLENTLAAWRAYEADPGVELEVWDGFACEYEARTDKAAGGRLLRDTHYRVKPKPESRRWTCPADVPFDVVYLRHKMWGKCERSVIEGVSSRGIAVANYGGVTWAELRDWQQMDGSPCETTEAS